MRFGGFGRVVSEFVDKRLKVGSLCHLLLVFALRRLTALLFGGVEGIKVGAFVVVETFRVLVDDVCGYLVEECSVVRDNEDCAGIVWR